MFRLINRLEDFCKKNNIVFVHNYDEQSGETRLSFSDNEGKRSFTRSYANKVNPDIAFDNIRQKLVDFFLD